MSAKNILLLFLSIMAIGLSGCNTVTVWQASELTNRLAPGDAVAIVLEHFAGEYSRAKEDEIVACVSKSLVETYPAVRVVQPEHFRRAALRGEAAQIAWGEVLKDDLVKRQIENLNLHYVISVLGETEEKSGFEGGIGGLAFEKMKTVRLKASIFDFKQGRFAAGPEVSAAGKLVMALLPIPFPVRLNPFTDSRACKELGQALAEFFIREKPKDAR